MFFVSLTIIFYLDYVNWLHWLDFVAFFSEIEDSIKEVKGLDDHCYHIVEKSQQQN